nr:hypothetical protein [Navicula tsukamotoi]
MVFVRTNYLILKKLPNMIKRFFEFLQRLERCEIYFPSIFWGVICTLSLEYSSIQKNQFLSNSNPIYIEKQVAPQSIQTKEQFIEAKQNREEFIEIKEHFLAPNLPGNNPGETGPITIDPEPYKKFPRGVETPPVGGGGIPRSGPEGTNLFPRIPREKTVCSAITEFKYKFDSNGNPIIIVPNHRLNNPIKLKEFYVEFDQTASHIHHIEDFQIYLPSYFDVYSYKRLSKTARIAYAKKTLSREKIIEYQHRIAQELSGDYSPNAEHRRGWWGKERWPAGGIIIEKYSEDIFTVNVVNSRGLHISSHRANKFFINNLRNNNYWIWSGAPNNRQ